MRVQGRVLRPASRRRSGKTGGGAAEREESVGSTLGHARLGGNWLHWSLLPRRAAHGSSESRRHGGAGLPWSGGGANAVLLDRRPGGRCRRHRHGELSMRAWVDPLPAARYRCVRDDGDAVAERPGAAHTEARVSLAPANAGWPRRNSAPDIARAPAGWTDTSSSPPKAVATTGPCSVAITSPAGR